MALIASLQPLGSTVVLSVGTTAHAGVQAPGSGTPPIQVTNYRIVNEGPNTVFLAYGTTSAGAVANALIPVDGTPGSGILVILANAVESFSLPANTWFSGICRAAQSAVVDILPGEGI